MRGFGAQTRMGWAFARGLARNALFAYCLIQMSRCVFMRQMYVFVKVLCAFGHTVPKWHDTNGVVFRLHARPGMCARYTCARNIPFLHVFTCARVYGIAYAIDMGMNKTQAIEALAQEIPSYVHTSNWTPDIMHDWSCDLHDPVLDLHGGASILMNGYSRKIVITISWADTFASRHYG